MVRRARLFGSSNVVHPRWGAVVGASHDYLPPHVEESVRERVRLVEANSATLRIAVPSEDLASWRIDGHLTTLRDLVARAGDGECSLIVTSFDQPVPLPELDPTHTLARFIVGPSNQTARHEVERAARKREVGMPPLYLHGPSGSGKTHLLQAVAQAVALENAVAAKEVFCLDAEDLATEMISAIFHDELAQFRSTYHGCRALIIDDIAALAERDATQNELCQTLETLVASGTPVIISGDRPPHALTQLSSELRSKLCSCPAAELRAPEFETRMAILLDRAERWGARPTQEVATYLTGVVGPDLAQIDRILSNLLIQHPAGEPLSDPDLVRRSLERSQRIDAHPSPASVISRVAKHFNLRVRDLRSGARSRRVTVPRQISMYLLREHCNLSYPEIGRRFGRHHTTALHSCRRVARELESDGPLKGAIRLISESIDAGDDGG